MNINRKTIGIIGSALLFFGVFAPVMRAPLIGSRSLFGAGGGDAVFLMILAVISLLVVLRERYRLLLVPGVLAMLVLVVDFVEVQSRVGKAKAEMSTSALGKAFSAGVAIEWGWAVLGLGVVLLFVAALRRDRITETRNN
jgi:hypothetical protein